MEKKKFLETNMIRGSVIGFTMLSILMPGIFTACSRGDEGIQEFVTTNNLNVTTTQVADIVNKAMEFPDMIILAGVEGDEGIVLDKSVDINAISSEEIIILKDGIKIINTTDAQQGTIVDLPEIEDKVEVSTRAGFVKSIVNAISGPESTSGVTNWQLDKAIKEEWLPKVYTNGEWAGPITREEAAYILVKVKGLERGWDYTYNDVEGTKYEREIMTVLSQGYLEGYSTGGFKPDYVLAYKDVQKLTENLNKSSNELKAGWALTSDGRKIRTTNLPANKDDFEYILADTDNKYYEEVNTFPRFEIVRENNPNIIPPVRVHQPIKGFSLVSEETRKEVFDNPENIKIISQRLADYVQHITNYKCGL